MYITSFENSLPWFGPVTGLFERELCREWEKIISDNIMSSYWLLHAVPVPMLWYWY